VNHPLNPLPSAIAAATALGSAQVGLHRRPIFCANERIVPGQEQPFYRIY
jgi:hypothetical protein